MSARQELAHTLRIAWQASNQLAPFDFRQFAACVFLVRIMSTLHTLPCLDSEQMAAAQRQELNIPRDAATALGRSAVEAARTGRYVTKAGQQVVWRDAVQAACAAKLSIRPDATLPSREKVAFTETKIQVANETTLEASGRLVAHGLQPLALNFANGVQPGGGFLMGARARRRCCVDPASLSDARRRSHV